MGDSEVHLAGQHVLVVRAGNAESMLELFEPRSGATMRYTLRDERGEVLVIGAATLSMIDGGKFVVVARPHSGRIPQDLATYEVDLASLRKP